MADPQKLIRQVGDALLERGVDTVQPCPRCGGTTQMCAPAPIKIPLSEIPQQYTFGEGAWPDFLHVAILICSRCGYLTQHVLRVLGIPTPEE